MDTVHGVFPGIADGASWYDWYTGERVDAQAGVNTSISAPLGHIPVYLRGGSITPLQEPGYTTTESRKNPWGLIVALDDDGDAKGKLYIDDGESIEQEATLNVRFEAKEGELRVDVEGEYKDANALGNVTVLGVFDGVGAGDSDSTQWRVDQMLFSQSANAGGPPLNFNLASAKGGDLTITATWWRDMLGVRDEDAFVQEVCDALVADMNHLGSC